MSYAGKCWVILWCNMLRLRILFSLMFITLVIAFDSGDLVYGFSAGG